MNHRFRSTIALLVTAVLILGAVPASASAGYRLQYSADDSTKLVGYVGTLPEVLEIPAGTTAIARETFLKNGDIRKVIIPSSVTTIGSSSWGSNGAFEGCANLEEVVLGSGMREIHQRTFASCPNLREVNLPDGLRMIGMEAFMNCPQLHGIQVPSSVTSIPSSAFRDSGITEAVVSNSNLDAGIDIFKGCVNLKTAQFNGPKLPFDTFSDCINLQRAVVGDDVQKIEHFAFSHCTNLTEVLLGKNITSIANDAFRECTSLRRIVLPQRLKSLGPYVFAACSQLEEIYIPASIETISSYVIKDCHSLNRILFGGSSSQWDAVVANVDLGLQEMVDFEVVFNVPAPVQNIPPVFSLSITDASGQPIARGIPAGSRGSFVSVADLVKALELPDGASARVVDAKGIEQVSDAAVGTGDIIELSGAPDLPQKITVVVTGDVLGTGMMSLSQLAAVAQALTGLKTLTGPYLMAADFNSSNVIDLTDLVKEAQLFQAAQGVS